MSLLHSIRRHLAIHLIAVILLGFFTAPSAGAAPAIAANAPAPATQPAASAHTIQFRLVRDHSSDQPVDWLINSSNPGEGKIPVLRDVLLDAADIAKVAPSSDANGTLSISITMTPEGTRRLKEATTANIGRRLAIVVDGKVLIAPTIRSAIWGGSVSLTMGQGKSQETREIIDQIQAAMDAHSAAAPTTRPSEGK